MPSARRSASRAFVLRRQPTGKRSSLSPVLPDSAVPERPRGRIAPSAYLINMTGPGPPARIGKKKGTIVQILAQDAQSKISRNPLVRSLVARTGWPAPGGVQPIASGGPPPVCVLRGLTSDVIPQRTRIQSWAVHKSGPWNSAVCLCRPPTVPRDGDSATLAIGMHRARLRLVGDARLTSAASMVGWTKGGGGSLVCLATLLLCLGRRSAVASFPRSDGGLFAAAAQRRAGRTLW